MEWIVIVFAFLGVLGGVILANDSIGIGESIIDAIIFIPGGLLIGAFVGAIITQVINIIF